MNLSVYIGFVTRFVQAYNRLPSLEECTKQKQDYETAVEPQKAYKLLDVFKRKKKPCEICNDYYEYAGADPSALFMFGTFSNKSQVDQFQRSGTITYVPLSDAGQSVRQSAVIDKLANLAQPDITTHEELQQQVNFYNHLEQQTVNAEQLSLQLTLCRNNEYSLKPELPYQYVVFKRQLQITQYRYQLDASGRPSWLHMQAMFHPATTGNIIFNSADVDQTVAQQDKFGTQFKQFGFMDLDMHFRGLNGVDKQLEVSTQSQKKLLVEQMQRVTTDEMIQLQSCQNRQQLIDVLKQLRKRLKDWNQVPLDQPVPDQYLEGVPHAITNKNAVHALCQFLWNTCQPNRIIVPLIPIPGVTYTKEPNRFTDIGASALKRMALPYAELQKQPNISNLTPYDIFISVATVY